MNCRLCKETLKSPQSSFSSRYAKRVGRLMCSLAIDDSATFLITWVTKAIREAAVSQSHEAVTSLGSCVDDSNASRDSLLRSTVWQRPPDIMPLDSVEADSMATSQEPRPCWMSSASSPKGHWTWLIK